MITEHPRMLRSRTTQSRASKVKFQPIIHKEREFEFTRENLGHLSQNELILLLLNPDFEKLKKEISEGILISKVSIDMLDAWKLHMTLRENFNKGNRND